MTTAIASTTTPNLSNPSDGSGGPAAEPRLRLAIQKDGRLTEPTLALLRGVGLDFDAYGQRLIGSVRNFPLDLLFTRDDDIPQFVAAGTADLGIVGRNVVDEEAAAVAVEELLPLGFGRCSLVVAVPKDGEIAALRDLEGRRIATKFPRSTQRFLAAHSIRAELVKLSGAIELAPTLGLAAAIVDITASGSMLLAHDLVPLHEIARSEAVLIAHGRALADPARRVPVDRLLVRIRASLAARRHKYLVMNAPRTALPEITRLVPGLKSPTVVPLADPEWVAVHTVVTEDAFWDVMEQLKAAGAGGILVVPIEKMLL
jgi:ATP phosphoribosyltransferase